MGAVERVLLTIWIGALWTVGYLAVPVLFAQLDDRMVAGRLAGTMFTVVAYVGLFAGAVLAARELVRSHGKPGWRFWVIATMLLLVAIGHFGLQPIMAELKIGGLLPGSERAAQFARFHGVSSILYLATSIGGFALVAIPRERSRD